VTEPGFENRNLENSIISHFISESTCYDLEITARDYFEIITHKMIKDMRVVSKAKMWRLTNRL